MTAINHPSKAKPRAAQFALVPRPPTPEMVDAGLGAYSSSDAPEDEVAFIFEAMVAAAPGSVPPHWLPDWDFSYDAVTNEVMVKAPSDGPGMKWIPPGGSLDRRLLHALGKAIAKSRTTP